MSAIVCTVVGIDKHPNADNLEILILSIWDFVGQDVEPVRVVTGPHYRIGQHGVYVKAGCAIPGYLAEDAWLVGRGKANQWYRVLSKPMRGIESPGLFFGQFYEKDTRLNTTFKDLRAENRAAFQTPLPDDHPTPNPVYQWRYWRDHWKIGQDVAPYLGVVFKESSGARPERTSGPGTQEVSPSDQ
jgi:hypothetical protein